jgi:hypothetical protein
LELQPFPYSLADYFALPMSPTLVSIIIVVYFAVLIGIPIITSKGPDTNTFFTANRQSPWYRTIVSPAQAQSCSLPTAGEINLRFFQNAFILNLPIKYTA